MGIKLPYRKKKEGGGGGIKIHCFLNQHQESTLRQIQTFCRGMGMRPYNFFFLSLGGGGGGGGGYEKKMQCTLFVSISISMHELSLNFNS